MSTLPTFVPGKELSQLLFTEAVEPILKTRFPNVLCSAALIGDGSEALGFDTPQSMDHHWGARLILFLKDADFENQQSAVSLALTDLLPNRDPWPFDTLQ